MFLFSIVYTLANFHCRETERESCGRLMTKGRTRRIQLEDLENAANLEACEDLCSERSPGRGRKMHKERRQCNCLCNFYHVCPGTQNGTRTGT